MICKKKGITTPELSGFSEVTKDVTLMTMHIACIHTIKISWNQTHRT